MKKVCDRYCGMNVHKKVVEACFLNSEEKDVSQPSYKFNGIAKQRSSGLLAHSSRATAFGKIEDFAAAVGATSRGASYGFQPRTAAASA